MQPGVHDVSALRRAVSGDVLERVDLPGEAYAFAAAAYALVSVIALLRRYARIVE